MKKALAISLMLFLGVSAYPLVGCSDKNQVEKIPELPTEIVPLGEPGVQIHYRRGDGKYHQWCLWLWGEGLDGQEYKFNYKDDYGAIAYYPLSHFNNPKSLGFIVKQTFEFAGDGNWVKDGQKDRFMDIEMLEQDENGAYHVYIQSGKSDVYVDETCSGLMNAVKLCQFENSKQITLETNNPIKDPIIKKDGVLLEGAEITGNKVKKTIKLSEDALISDQYTIDIEFAKGGKVTKNVSIRKLYDIGFDSKYFYNGDLGAIYTKESTTFKVWSPISKSIELRIYDNGTPISVNAEKGNDTFTSYKMEKEPTKGVFEYTVAGDLEGKYYTYFVKNSYNPDGKEIVDPYAKSAGVSGKRGMIVDFSKTNPAGWDEVGYDQTNKKQLTVYETHVSDLTSSDTWNGNKDNAKKFKGMIEKGTTYTEGKETVSTGFDHIKELGVNAVQVIPFFDQANDETDMKFNWGYNPLNYNVVEGGYSSDPYDGYARIRELKEVIKAFKDEDISFIMDVVYNHVSGLSGSNFDVLMPFYYFRYSNTGGASSGSGCGNDTASERNMFRKFMIDSTEFWTKEYKLDGFRFDLMGLHDVATMNYVVKNLKEINPNITVYGEAWNMGTELSYSTSLANQNNASKFVGYGQFNDKGRDAMIAGGLSGPEFKAWMNNTNNPVQTTDLLKMIKGQTSGVTTDPDKTVNYVACHDNYTLHDRNIAAGIYDEKAVKNYNIIANSVVMTSQGTSFMLSGDEMNRTKIEYDAKGKPIVDKKVKGKKIYKVSHNSYSSSYKTNEIDWSLKIKNKDMIEYYKKLIWLKTNVSDLALNETEIKNSTTFSTKSERTDTIIVTKFSDKTYDYAVYISSPSLYNYDKDSKDPYTIDLTNKEVYLATRQSTLNKTSIKLNPAECVITRSAR